MSMVYIPDYELKRAKEFLLKDGYENPSDNLVLNVAIKIRNKMREQFLTAEIAYKNIMH